MTVTTAKSRAARRKVTCNVHNRCREQHYGARRAPRRAEESQSFPSAKELAKLSAEWPVSRLVDTWNSFAGVAPFDELKPVKKLTSRGAAVTRIWQAVARLSPDGAQSAADVAPAKGKPKKSPAKATRRARAQKRATRSGARTRKRK
jgi:hypothetical protein